MKLICILAAAVLLICAYSSHAHAEPGCSVGRAQEKFDELVNDALVRKEILEAEGSHEYVILTTDDGEQLVGWVTTEGDQVTVTPKANSNPAMPPIPKKVKFLPDINTIQPVSDLKASGKLTEATLEAAEKAEGFAGQEFYFLKGSKRIPYKVKGIVFDKEGGYWVVVQGPTDHPQYISGKSIGFEGEKMTVTGLPVDRPTVGILGDPKFVAKNEQRLPLALDEVKAGDEVIINGERAKVVEVKVKEGHTNYLKHEQVVFEVGNPSKKVTINPSKLSKKYNIHETQAKEFSAEDWVAIQEFDDAISNGKVVSENSKKAVTTLTAALRRLRKGCNSAVELCTPKGVAKNLQELVPYLGDDVVITTVTGVRKKGILSFAGKTNDDAIRLIDGGSESELNVAEIGRIQDKPTYLKSQANSSKTVTVVPKDQAQTPFVAEVVEVKGNNIIVTNVVNGKKVEVKLPVGELDDIVVGENKDLIAGNRKGSVGGAGPRQSAKYHTPAPKKVSYLTNLKVESNLKSYGSKGLDQRPQLGTSQVAVVYSDGENVFRQSGYRVVDDSLSADFIWIENQSRDLVKIPKNRILEVQNPLDAMPESVVNNLETVAQKGNRKVKVVYDNEKVVSGTVASFDDYNHSRYVEAALEEKNLKPKDAVVIRLEGGDGVWSYEVIPKNEIREFGILERPTNFKEGVDVAVIERPRIGTRGVSEADLASGASKFENQVLPHDGVLGGKAGSHDVKVSSIKVKNGKLKSFLVEFTDDTGKVKTRKVDLDEVKAYFDDVMKDGDFDSLTMQDWISLHERVRKLQEISNPKAKWLRAMKEKIAKIVRDLKQWRKKCA